MAFLVPRIHAILSSMDLLNKEPVVFSLKKQRAPNTRIDAWWIYGEWLRIYFDLNPRHRAGNRLLWGKQQKHFPSHSIFLRFTDSPSILSRDPPPSRNIGSIRAFLCVVASKTF